MHIVSASQMQHMDHATINDFGIPGIVLMENAGRGSVEFIMERYNNLESKKVAVIAGRGNNGGDGFVIARYLLDKGIDVSVFLLSEAAKVSGDAKVNLDLFKKLCKAHGQDRVTQIVDAETLNQNRTRIFHHDLFVDAVLGTGLNSDVRGFFKDAVELMNASPSPVFSVDIPSGLNSDTGHPMGIAVRADATATFAFAKRGHVIYPGNTYSGELRIVDIGIPKHMAEQEGLTLKVLEKNDIAARFTPRGFNAHKGSFGHLLVVAGSTGKTGAAALCSNAAMRCGTGLVTLGIAKSLNKRIEPMVVEPMTVPLPEKDKGFLSENSIDDIMTLLEGKQALALGPGIGTQKSTVKLVKKLVEKSPVPMVIDADGLNCIADDPDVLLKKKAPAVLTPHPGEMSRLSGAAVSDIQEDRLGSACRFAERYNSILVLKGAQSIIALPDGRAFVCPTGNPGMASGGMGDVLTGMISGFCTQGFPPEDAAVCGVYIHGLCADILAEEKGAFGFLASDLVSALPETIHKHLL